MASIEATDENSDNGVGECATGEDLDNSADYSKYGITDAPKTTKRTALGRTKTLASLFLMEWVFLVLSMVNILAAGTLTIVRLVQVVQDDPKSPDFAFTILLLVNAGFCMFYVIHGVFRERVYEIYAFIAAILVVLLYCILEYAVFNPDHRTVIKLVRLIIACFLAPPNVLVAYFVSKGFGFLEFRIVGPLQYMHKIYRQAAVFSCLVKFDLQAASSVVVLALEDGTSLSLLETLTLALGLPFSLFWSLLGWVVLRRELKPGAVVFAAIGIAKPAYYVYKLTTVYSGLTDHSRPTDSITYSLLAAVAIAVLVWAMVMVDLVIVYRNFGKGLKERPTHARPNETSALLPESSSRR